MGIGRMLGRDGGAPVVVLDEAGKEGVGRIDIRDACQAQPLDQAVLKCLIGAFDPSLGLGRVGMDRLDVEGPEGAGELGQLALPLRMVDPEDTVFV